MSQITGKTVYILGAGASHHTGAPLLKDFLVAARSIRESKRDLKYKDSFDRTFEWIDSLRGSSYYVDFDLDNLEHVFSLTEMCKQLNIRDGDLHSSDLRYLILESLDNRCKLVWRGGEEKHFYPDRRYSFFGEILRKLNKDRMEYLGKSDDSFERDVIVTFNYDTMLDYAFNYRGDTFDYCLNTSGSHGAYKFLKLHGSTNWASCKKCANNKIQIVSPQPFAEGKSYYLGEYADGKEYDFKMVTAVLPNTICKQCKTEGVLEPFIIPPTWSKTVSGSPLVDVWASTVKELSEAFQLIVIGYSMPPTDTFFQYLLTLGLESNPNLYRVIVVNVDRSDDFKKRYEKVFSRNLIDRGRLIFLPGLTFQGFLGDNFMPLAGGQVDWP